MMPQTPDPDEPAALAARVGDPTRPDAERSAAVAALRPLHLRTARRVLQRFACSDPAARDDLVGEVELALARGDGPPQGVRYAAWCWVRMRNTVVNGHRRWGARAMALPAVIPAPRPVPPPDPPAAFGDADLGRVADWPPRDRVLVLCQALLWGRVPETVWAGWLTDAGVTPPFPPDGFADLADAERNEAIRAALGIPTRNGLNQRSRRRWPDLLALDLVRGLRNG